jgi:small subunit ribosomal protein S21
VLPLALSLHRRKGIGVSLLAIHAPVTELVEGDWLAGHGAAHVSARPKDAKIAIEKFNLRFASVDRSTLESVHLKDPDLAVLCHDAGDKGTATLPWIRKRSGQEIASLLKAAQLALRGVSECARQFSDLSRLEPQNTG